jgi:predicted RNA binding protein YcfA (HicA-like mRNA interferase family)
MLVAKNTRLQMNYNELTKLMKESGWYFERNGKGSHKMWRHPNRTRQIAVPDHGSKEIDPSLLKGIKKQAGLK